MTDPILSPTAQKLLDHATAERKQSLHHTDASPHSATHEDAEEYTAQPVDTPAPTMQHRRPSIGDMISRTIFGGFWALVAAGLAWTGLSLIFTGDMSGFITVGVSVLPGLYARYIFRGGRFRLLFW